MSVVIKLRNYGLFDLVKSLFYQFEAEGRRRLMSTPFVLKKIFNYWMYLDLKDAGISKQLLKYRKRELDHKWILEQVLRPGNVVLDIGANIGYYALMELDLVGEEGFVLAVEPSPSNVALLTKNVQYNKYNNYQILSAAVSDKEELKEFYLSRESNLNTFHDTGSIKKHLSGETIEVRTYPVSKVLEQCNRVKKIDLIRMDVEGHEVSVINGLLPDIRSGSLKPRIVFETHISRYNQDNNMLQVLDDLFELGYGVQYMASSKESGTELINKLGYTSELEIKTDGVSRALYRNITLHDAKKIICETGGCRTVCLSPDRA